MRKHTQGGSSRAGGAALTWVLAALLLGISPGCGTAEPSAPIVVAPVDPGPVECAVCGMTVRDQPSPRGQVLHRNGEHKHFCALGDLRAYLQTPTPLGTPTAVWVEDLGPDFELLAFDVAPRPYIAADDATYVVGSARPRIMGLPILSFSDPDVANRHASGAAKTAIWADLVTTPFNQIPKDTP